MPHELREGSLPNGQDRESWLGATTEYYGGG